MKKRLISILCVLTMIVGLATGCGDSENSESVAEDNSEKEDVFNIAITYQPDSLLPVGTYDSLISILRPIYEPLFATAAGDEGLEYYLADSLDISEDGLTYTISLNEDATWSDGEPIVAGDVLFTVEYNNLVSGTGSSFGYMSGQEVVYNAVDEKTVEIVLPVANASFIVTLGGLRPMPSHAFDGDPSKIDGSDYFKTPGMATSGAYTVAEINEDSYVFEKRDDYYRGTPDVDKVVMKTIGEGSTEQVAFENGEISYIPISNVEQLKQYDGNDNYNVYSIPQAKVNFFWISPRSANITNEDARKAIFLAIDPQEIVDVTYGDERMATVANEYLTPEQTLYDASIKSYEQNLEEAKALAKSSGLEGTTIDYLYNTERPGMESIATVIQQQLAEIGVTVRIEGLSNSAYLEKWKEIHQTEGNTSWDIVANGFTELRGNSIGYWSSYFVNASGAYGFGDEIKEVANTVNTTTDMDEAQKLATQMQEAILDTYSIYPICYTNYVLVSQKNVTGLDECAILPEFLDYLTIKID